MDTVRDLARVKKSRQSAASDVASGHTNGRPDRLRGASAASSRAGEFACA